MTDPKKLQQELLKVDEENRRREELDKQQRKLEAKRRRELEQERRREEKAAYDLRIQETRERIMNRARELESRGFWGEYSMYLQPEDDFKWKPAEADDYQY